MREMRVLTVRQPYAWAILHGGKNIENRTRNIAGSYRGPIAIHAAAAPFEDDGQYWEVARAIRSEELGWPASDGEVGSGELIDATHPRFTYGAIIGVVDLAGVHLSKLAHTRSHHGATACFTNGPRIGQLCSKWAEPGQPEVYHLQLENPRALADPIPHRGALGLRRLDPAIIAAVERRALQPA